MLFECMHFCSVIKTIHSCSFYDNRMSDIHKANTQPYGLWFTVLCLIFDYAQ